MAANIQHFAIEADDVERARRFYERVFGWRFEAWGPPDFYRIHTGTPADAGIGGALQARRQPLSGTGNRTFECTVGVDDLGPIVAAVEANGGRIEMAEFRIEGVGNLINFIDTEGNRVGVMKYDEGHV